MSLTKDIESLLPHRKPFLFVDEIMVIMHIRFPTKNINDQLTAN